MKGGGQFPASHSAQKQTERNFYILPNGRPSQVGTVKSAITATLRSIACHASKPLPDVRPNRRGHRECNYPAILAPFGRAPQERQIRILIGVLVFARQVAKPLRGEHATTYRGKHRIRLIRRGFAALFFGTVLALVLLVQERPRRVANYDIELLVGSFCETSRASFPSQTPLAVWLLPHFGQNDKAGLAACRGNEGQPAVAEKR